MRTDSPNGKNGLTRIELLIVIAIVAILAALLLPVSGKAKIQAQKSYCTNNLKQIQYAWVTYCGENDDRIVPLSNHWPNLPTDPLIQPGAAEAQLYPGSVSSVAGIRASQAWLAAPFGVGGRPGTLSAGCRSGLLPAVIAIILDKIPVSLKLMTIL